MVFPTTILSRDGQEDYGKKVVEYALAKKASVIISLGLASAAKGVRVERMCSNWVENDWYCTAFENRKPASSERPVKERLAMPLERWSVERLRRKLGVVGILLEISDDAGGYCCNALMYRTLLAMQNLRVSIPFIFAHVPCTAEAVTRIPDFDERKVILRRRNLIEGAGAILQTFRPWSSGVAL
jgi:pyrrolidone-carboxylate peptidase